jgi:hypothetical protein
VKLRCLFVLSLMISGCWVWITGDDLARVTGAVKVAKQVSEIYDPTNNQHVHDMKSFLQENARAWSEFERMLTQ